MTVTLNSGAIVLEVTESATTGDNRPVASASGDKTGYVCLTAKGFNPIVTQVNSIGLIDRVPEVFGIEDNHKLSFILEEVE